MSAYRILLVEDDPTNQLLATELLGGFGCEVELAQNGFEAVAAAGARDFDVVLMDCRMPQMDGFEATRQIRAAQKGRRRIPIVALTANAMNGDREKCLQAGMDDFLAKPIIPADLWKMVERWAQPAEAEPPLFDAAAALARVGSADLLARLAVSFVRSLPEIRRRMDEALSDRDGDTLSLAAHTLLGSLGMFSASTPLGLARELEVAARAGDWQVASGLYACLARQLGQLEPAIAALAEGHAVAGC